MDAIRTAEVPAEEEAKAGAPPPAIPPTEVAKLSAPQPLRMALFTDIAVGDAP
jgi:hypothetical protein